MSGSLPSSFASAAAGHSRDNDRQQQYSRTESGDWSRKTNGTGTFRRTSTTLNNQSSGVHSSSSMSKAQNSQMNASWRNTSAPEGRFTKDELLDIFRHQRASGDLDKHLDRLLLGDFAAANHHDDALPGWTRKSEDQKNAPNVGLCWNESGSSFPMSLESMTAQEREIFAGSVNSVVKQSLQTAGKDSTGTPNNSVGRKSSFTAAYSSSSLSGNKPAARRRETSDSLLGANSLSSPTGGSRFFREDPSNTTSPPSLARRRNELRESIFQPLDLEIPDDSKADYAADAASPFANLLKRSTTGPLTAVPGNMPASPWSNIPASATIAPSMGGPGGFGMGGTNKTGSGSLRDNRSSQGQLRSSISDVHAPERAMRSGLARLPEGDFDDDVFASKRQSMSQSRAQPPSSDPRARHSNPFDPSGDQISRQVSDMGPLSPTTTNPYQSPQMDRLSHAQTTSFGPEEEQINNADHQLYRAGAGAGQAEGANRNSQPAAFANPERSFGDRSSGGPNGISKGNGGFGGFAGLGGMGMQAWTSSNAGNQDGDRSFYERSGQQSFESLQSPPLGGSTSANVFDPAMTISGSQRSNRSGSTFQNSMTGSLPTSEMDQSQRGVIGSRGVFRLGNAAPGYQGEDNDRDGRAPRSNFDLSQQMYRSGEATGREIGLDRQQSFTSPEHRDLSQSSFSQQQHPSANATGGQRQNPLSADSQQPNLPASMLQPHHKVMVMPDRMRWVYQDPSGKVQGPFTGLEMHDWYKAGFFTPELLVKKAEDNDYEPLGQMIRRIGNSREPFLVPQVGVPHDPPAGQEPAPFSGTTLSPTTQAAGTSSQPPFAGSFPSFGTTLTAEQQNALERRKQEEQYLMARQREYLVQQQGIQRQSGGYGPGGAMLQNRSSQKNLNHHASAHSLHSQPSFGSMTSPIYQQQLSMQMHGAGGPSLYGGVPGSRIGSYPPGQPPFQDPQGNLDEDGLGRLLARQSLTGHVESSYDPAIAPPNMLNASQVNPLLAQRLPVAQDQPRIPFSQPNVPFRQTPGTRNDRLEEFHALQGITNQEQAARGMIPGGAQQNAQQYRRASETPEVFEDSTEFASRSRAHENEGGEEAQRGIDYGQIRSPQADAYNAPSDLPQPFPPVPQSSTPLPAPTPQKVRQPLAEALTDESQLMMQDPSVDVESHLASIAPWAKGPSDVSKGPSLKEIQASEAHRAAIAAQAEEVLARERRQQEAERAKHVTPPAPPPPGLPESSTWGKSAAAPSQAPVTASSVWSTTQKRAALSNVRSLAQIQKDEEDRAQRAAAAAAAANKQANANLPSSGKRYAELASKSAKPAVSSSSSSSTANAWSTIGAGGKVKSLASTGSGSAASKPASASHNSGLAPKSRPTGSRTASSAMTSQTEAQTQFRKWAKTALKGLNNEINVDDFTQQLLSFPPDSQLIAECVHANSQTIDSNRFAEEFIRRRKLAESGKVDSSPFNPSPATEERSGWSEVAKKTAATHAKESEAGSHFKVVSAKKKTTRK